MGGRGNSSGLSGGSSGASPGQSPVRAADAKDLQELHSYMSSKYFVAVDDQSLAKHDFESVRKAASEIEDILTEFPQAVDHSVNLLSGNLYNALGKNAYAGASLRGQIFMNDIFQDRQNLENSYQHDLRTHWHPEGTTADHIVTHEMGHLLERALIQKLNVSSWQEAEEWVKHRQSSRIVSEACKIAKKTPEGKGLKNNQLIEQVSRYATKNRGETLAECVADYKANGANAKPLSVAVWKLLKRDLG